MDNILWCQSLDNHSPDAFAINNIILTEKEMGQQRKLALELSKIKREGKVLINEDLLRCHLLSNLVSIEVETASKDVSGRFAIIVFLRETESWIRNDGAETAWRAFTDFSDHIGIQLRHDLMKLLVRCRETLLNPPQCAFQKILTRLFSSQNIGISGPSAGRISNTGRQVLPDDAFKRKIIIVLTEEQRKKCFSSGECDFINDDTVAILTNPISDNCDVELSIANLGLNLPGNILIQSPFNRNKYVLASKAAVDFALEKIEIFSQMCSLLGAREILVEEVREESSAKHTERSAVIGVSTASGQISNTKSVIKRFRDKIKWHDKFNGGEAEISSAEILVRESNLQGEIGFTQLIELRRGRNQLKQRSVKIDVGEESERELTRICRMEIPEFLYELQINCRDMISTSFRCVVNINVVF